MQEQKGHDPLSHYNFYQQKNYLVHFIQINKYIFSVDISSIPPASYFNGEDSFLNFLLKYS